VVRKLHHRTLVVHRNKPCDSETQAMSLDESMIYRLMALMAWISQRVKRVPV